MAKYFLGSVGYAEAFKQTANGLELLFRATSLTDSGINVTSSQDEIRGGTGAPVQFVFNHDVSVEVTLTDVYWEKAYIEAQLGDSFSGANAQDLFSETKTAAGTSIQLSYTPESVSLTCGEGIYIPVWYSIQGKDDWHMVEATHLSGKTVSGLEPDITYCFRYSAKQGGAHDIWVKSNMIPSELYLFITTPLYAGDACAASNGKLAGHLTFEIPRFVLPGAFDLGFSMSSNTTMSLSGKAMALSGSCDSAEGANLMRIVEFIEGKGQFDDLIAIYIDPTFVPALNAFVPVYGVYGGGRIARLNVLGGWGTVAFTSTIETSGSDHYAVVTASVTVGGHLIDQDIAQWSGVATLSIGNQVTNNGKITAITFDA